jgi:hypothetical protein
MATGLSEKDNISLFKAGYWTAKKWFTLLVIILVLWTGIYIVAHSSSGIRGYEYTRFTTAEIKQVNRILNPELNAARPKKVNSLPPATDSNGIIISEQAPAENDIAATCDLPCRIDKAEFFISGEFDNKIMPGQLGEIRNYINTFGPQEAGIYLVDYKLKVQSYFWLTGRMLYLEIISWTIIGVLCSLLFAIGSIVRKKSDEQDFNPNEIIYQVAKIFYAPFIAVIIILAYTYFTNGLTLNISAGEGVIVFSFIAGFYSGRVMNFLDRLKQLLIPGSYTINNNEATEKYIREQLAKTPKPFVNPLLQGETIGSPAPAQAAPESIEDFEYIPEKKTDDKEISEVDIDLKLDLNGLYDTEKEELQKVGFNRAIVTLHNVNGKDIIPAKRNEKNPSRFIAHGVKPGIYIARATLSQRLKDDYIINLFGEKTSYVTIDKPGLELFVKKYESVD